MGNRAIAVLVGLACLTHAAAGEDPRPPALPAQEEPAPKGEEAGPAKPAPAVKDAPAAVKDVPAQEPPAKAGSPVKEASKPTAKPEPAKSDRPAPAPKTVAEALAILGRMTVSVTWERTPLRDVVAHLGAVTGMNMIVGPALLADGAADAILVDLRVRGVSARQALALAVDGRDLGLRMQGTVLVITTRKDARGKPILRLHAIGDLLLPIRDFPGPDLLLRPAGSEPRAEEAKETKHPFGDGDDLVEMVKAHTGTGTWEEDGISVSVAGDWLLVRQYADVQGEVGRLLALLRTAR